MFQLILLHVRTIPMRIPDSIMCTALLMDAWR